MPAFVMSNAGVPRLPRTSPRSARQQCALRGPGGSPAALPAYAVTPEVIFGMGTSDELAPRSTRYQF
jgi:hypothetical protein